jgi:quercetin dioxygenase-like cupin family protein
LNSAVKTRPSGRTTGDLAGAGDGVPAYVPAMENDTTTAPTPTTLLKVRPPGLPDPAHVMTVLIELPPGDPGSPPHRHPGPVFGYVTEGELRYRIDGRPERVIRAGEALWEPGGSVIHLRAANNLADEWTRFIAVMVCEPGRPMIAPVGEDELAALEQREAA